MKRFFIVLVIFTMLSCFIRVAAAQDIDPALIRAVRASLAIRPEEPINWANLKMLTDVGGQITSLSGLERATNLVDLRIATSPISDLTPLANLRKLKHIKILAAEVSDISPLAGLTQLKMLSLQSPITDLTPLAELSGLWTLYLSGSRDNDITPLAGLTQLVALGLEANQISDLTPLAGLTRLVGLDVQRNQIMDITPLAGLTQLKSLDLLRNQISDLTPLAGLTQLKSLDLSENQINDLTPLAGLTQLEGINLARNQISDLTPLSELTGLVGLDLSVNQISNLMPLEKLTRLEGLSLACNQIINVTTLAKLTDLEWLDLTGNPIPDRILLEDLPLVGDRSNAYIVVIFDIHLKDVEETYLWFVMGTVEIYFQHPTYFELALWEASAIYPEIYLQPYAGECPEKVPDQDVSLQDAITANGNNDDVMDIGGAVPLNVKKSMVQQLTPMYWISTTSGIIHCLMGVEVENLVTDAHNPNSLAIDAFNEKLYWTERTSNTTGEIWRANLDGSNVELVKELTSAPLEIILDPVGRKLYLVNGWGKIQRMNPDGTDFQSNFITGLQAPVHVTIDVVDSKLYWTQKTSNTTGEIWRANLDGSNVELVKALTSVPLGIAIDSENSKLYLTNGWGKIQRMNPDGTGFQSNFITGLQAPKNIMLDRDNIYWTEGNRIRRVPLNGGNIQDVLTDLGGPTALILDRLIPADMPKDVDSERNGIAPQLENGQVTEPSKLEADVNEDGVVNIQDLVLVASHFGKTDAGDADVNADGVVNITDLVLVANKINQ